MKRRTPVVVAVLMALTCASALAQSLLNPKLGVGDQLRALSSSDKPVTLALKNGHSYTGKIAEVGDHSVLVSQLSGKEFFDAVVSIDEIAAIEVRVRDR